MNSAATAARCARPCGAAPVSPPTIVRALDDAGMAVDDIQVHPPSLDDVFFALTGQGEGPADELDDERAVA